MVISWITQNEDELNSGSQFSGLLGLCCQPASMQDESGSSVSFSSVYSHDFVKIIFLLSAYLLERITL